MGLSAFLKENTETQDNLRFVASDRFVETDDDGNKTPVKWEIRSLSTTEEEVIKKQCTKRVKVGRMYQPETDYNEYLGKLAAACTVEPNLNAKELQDSYGVMGSDKVLKEMLLPGEYANYLAKVQEFNGFDLDMDEMVDEAKN